MDADKIIMNFVDLNTSVHKIEHADSFTHRTGVVNTPIGVGQMDSIRTPSTAQACDQAVMIQPSKGSNAGKP